MLISEEPLSCIDSKGRANHILIMHIPETGMFHSNQADECYYRTGDGSKKLNFQERLALMYAKGVRYFEDEPVYRASLADIDLLSVENWIKRIGYPKSVDEYLRENGAFVREENGKTVISGAAILLFGKFPQKFFPRAQIRFIRYEGTEEKTGAEMNVIKDVSFQGKLLEQTQAAFAFIKSQIKEHTYLNKDGHFVTVPEYPEFCWMELIVNAVAHRDYGILGTDIQVKMFDEHITVESPGILPGLVTESNIRHTHFSRNPKIAQFLKEYELVREFGEGIDRIYRELEEAKLPDPLVKAKDFMVRVTIKNSEPGSTPQATPQATPQVTLKVTPQITTISFDSTTRNGSKTSFQPTQKITPQATQKATPQATPKVTLQEDENRRAKILVYCETPRRAREIMTMLGLSDIKSFKSRYLGPMLAVGVLKKTSKGRSTSPNQRYQTRKRSL